MSSSPPAADSLGGVGMPGGVDHLGKLSKETAFGVMEELVVRLLRDELGGEAMAKATEWE